MRAALGRATRLGLALALLGGVALAQDTAVKKPKRPQPLPAPAVSTAPIDASNGVAPGTAPSDIPAPNPAAPAPLLPLRGPQGLGASAAPPVLRSAVRSRWSAPASIATRGESACRAQCATTRLACLAPAVEDDVGRCNTGWTSCLSTCDGLGYTRAPSPPGP